MVQAGMAAIAVLVVGLFVYLQQRASKGGVVSAVAAAVWLGLWFAVASSGLLRDFDARPPRLMLVFGGTLAMSLALAFSPVGRRLSELPVWLLIAVNGFRLPLELVMHEAATQGIMPVQMSFSGWNFDIVTGVTALVVAALEWKGRAPRPLIFAWLALAFVTLGIVVTIALVSTPMIHAFGTAPAQLNTWVADAPYVWLPTVMVVFAFTTQVVLARKLAR